MTKRDEAATVDLKVRMKEPLRAALEGAAQKAGVSMNAEAVARLQRTFSEDDALGGPAMKRLSHVMIASFFVGGEQASLGKGGKPIEEWLSDPDCYRAAVVNLIDALVQRAPDWEEGKDLYFLAIKSRLATREMNDNAR